MWTIVLIFCMFFSVSSSKGFKSHCLRKTRHFTLKFASQIIMNPISWQELHFKYSLETKSCAHKCRLIAPSTTNLLDTWSWFSITLYLESSTPVTLKAKCVLAYSHGELTQNFHHFLFWGINRYQKKYHASHIDLGQRRRDQKRRWREVSNRNLLQNVSAWTHSAMTHLQWVQRCEGFA